MLDGMVGGWKECIDFISLEGVDTGNFQTQTGLTEDDIKDFYDGKYIGIVTKNGNRLGLNYVNLMDDRCYHLLFGSVGSRDYVGCMWELILDYNQDEVTCVFSEV